MALHTRLASKVKYGSSVLWTRRTWLARNVTAVLVVAPVSYVARRFPRITSMRSGMRPDVGGRKSPGGQLWAHPASTGPGDWVALAQDAVDAAMRAGAQYADARLTRTVQHRYNFYNSGVIDLEEVGVGVRALVDGYWGFTACPSGDKADVTRLAGAAVSQARVNARSASPRTVVLGQIPVAVGQWATPVVIDPFTISIEEKRAFIEYWVMCAEEVGLQLNRLASYLHFVRHESAVATSDGGRFTQTVFESGGEIEVSLNGMNGAGLPIEGIETAGCGWELLLNAKIPDQIRAARDAFRLATSGGSSPAAVGRYTLVCDGATMAALLSATLGVATQLDRALGYEANAGGTSFLNDPLAMLGTFKVAAPQVTVTANRSAPTQLATVKWDDEGTEPPDMTLVKDGVLVDYQTTREQAAWLAPYYARINRPVRSNGCAAAENALGIPLQQMPNLSLEPRGSVLRIEDLVANVKDGILLERGEIQEMDFQARSGLLGPGRRGQFRKIKNGKLGRILSGGAVLIETLDLWKHVLAVGGPLTRAVRSFSKYPWGGEFGGLVTTMGGLVKGEPPQWTSHSVQAVAATIADQPLINPERKV